MHSELQAILSDAFEVLRRRPNYVITPRIVASYGVSTQGGMAFSLRRNNRGFFVMGRAEGISVNRYGWEFEPVAPDDPEVLRELRSIVDELVNGSAKTTSDRRI